MATRPRTPNTAQAPPITPTQTSTPASQTTTKSSRPHSRSGAQTNTSASSPASSLKWLSHLRRPRTAPNGSAIARPPVFARSLLSDDVRRDSALQPGTLTPAEKETVPSTAVDGGSDDRKKGLPAIVVQREEEVFNGRSGVDVESEVNLGTEANGDGKVREGASATSTSRSDLAQLQQPRSAPPSQTTFSGITMAIPTGSFEDLGSPDKIQFSNRGSMLLDGKRAANAVNGTADGTAFMGPASPRSPSITSNSLRPTNESRTSLAARQTRVLSPDEAELSQRVRSMYEFGNERGVDWSERTVLDNMVEEEEGDCDETDKTATNPTQTVAHTPNQLRQIPSTAQHSTKKRESIIPWEPHEAAGGLEDWQDVGGDEVDRYGFILPKKAPSRGSNNSGANTNPSSPQQLMRVSTALVEFSESPRRKRTVRRSASRNSAQTRDGASGRLRRRLSKSSRTSLHPPGSIYSTRSTSSLSVHQSPLRYASNRLPHNRERRWMDEASDMLTLPPGLEDLAVAKEGGKTALALKKKEWQREEKWRKMGKPTATAGDKGGGMAFEFNPRDPKVISRTWKGIPDKWRASAWYSFLAASARKQASAHSDAELIDLFLALQQEASPDDVQIDTDVPRTINRHIMFRRRYRGGQRLLFRVLHALSLYFPESGYVQGMAAVAATLLCYYDEEKAFIMMVRLWQCRGLERLYSAGFGGLMECLEEFEGSWLRGGEVARKLEELAIPPTSYGTRWYLTLFNYSIPFPAQLRVWDCFMLLGDVSNACPPTPSSSKSKPTKIAPTDPINSFNADLDVLHATSAALIDATREILLDSDFENAMKVLTSWVPVKDEDLLMKVAHAEWRVRKKRG